MALNRDFSDLFAALNAAGVEYLLVGGYALAVHATPRFTKDLDVWVNATPENAARVLPALASFGAPLQDLSVEDLSRPDILFQMGLPPNRIGVLTRIDGIDFAEAWPEHVTSRYGQHEIPVISRRHLVQNKRASGRPQDLVDVELLLRPGGAD